MDERAFLQKVKRSKRWLMVCPTCEHADNGYGVALAENYDAAMDGFRWHLHLFHDGPAPDGHEH